MLNHLPLPDATLQIPQLLSTWLQDAVQARTKREWAIFALMGQRSLLMQIAHPLVARAVDEHSSFRHNPLQRLAHTFDLSMKLFAGTEEEARRAAAAINRAHIPVKGPGYDARDPHLGLWVWATLVDGALVGHDLFIGALTAPEKQVIVDTCRRRGALLGLQDNLPRSAPAVKKYVAHQIANGVVHAGRTARRLAQPMLGPRPAPLQNLTAYLARATLPPSLRAQYNLPWSLPAELTFTMAICPLANRLLSRLTPEMVFLQDTPP